MLCLRWPLERGYAMVALLIALSIMSVMLTVAMPVWKQMAQREKEEELIFRGKQYARAIGLFQRRAGPGALPPNLDILVEQRFLRKKYKDPITGDDFQPLLAGQAIPGQAAPTTAAGGRSAAGGPLATPGFGSATGPGRGPTVGANPTQPGAAPTVGAPVGGVAGAAGGIQGVVSKSKAKSIRIYNGRSVYNEWAFIFVPQVQAAGGGAPGPQGPGVPGVGAPGGPGRQQGPGGRGGPAPFGGPPGPGRQGNPSPFGGPRGVGPGTPVPFPPSGLPPPGGGRGGR